ncbi:hypothetical protein LTR70_005860 [Exophiala xenobiotica]|uniref:L-tryptophan decarboxylase PsiD-like domain-containing protein n=1 Tax=Lithohypha guttulata TaxID=1690604 RepID=A0ABR0K8Y2_9EURO|nr:hypothetical protein LTR24_005456 [Lithohypha guttulata]KAK5317360.1 hypothetical protein LTR70_005860 [Exophiala xenobiotica]
MQAHHQIRTQALGHWLPKDRNIIAQWLAEQVKNARQQEDETLEPSLQKFKAVVEGDPALIKLANDMFTEVPNRDPYRQDPTGTSQIRNFNDLLITMNNVMKQGPQFFDKAEPKTAMGLIGFPINAILDWPMATKSGYYFFMEPKVNAALQAVLNSWGTFLKLPESQACLNGWLSTDGRNLIAAKGNDGKTSYTFDQMYMCDPSAPFLGYDTWDHFFTRQFRDGIRPVAAPDNAPPDVNIPNPTVVINNACESAPLQFVKPVKWQDSFQLKGQPYSLGDMLNYNKLAQQFIGGTVYQAFLSALSYHRWHAPVSGTVVDVEIIPGTYYSENMYEGFMGKPDDPDPAAPNYSQPYISAVATRGIIYIRADNPLIDLMAIVFIGMAEVSSCEFTVTTGSHITKGQEIGMFHFGGSSHCMVFQPGIDLNFVTAPPWDMDTEYNFMVNSALAVVTNSKDT